MASRTNLAVCLLGASTAAAHVLLPFSQRSHNETVSRLVPRDNPVQLSLKSAEYPYLVDVTVGTPPQKLALVISASSGLTWVPDAETSACSPEWYYQNRYCEDSDYEPKTPPSYCPWGSFNATLSETYLKANRRYLSFSDETASGSRVMGANFTDKLVVGDIQLDDFPIGLVDSVDNYAPWLGVLGLGHNDSYYYWVDDGGEYANFLDRVVSSGNAATPAYSMWLDNAEGTSGGLLFGAVDRSRYTGDLIRLREDHYSDSTPSRRAFYTIVTSLSGTASDGSAMPAIRTNDFPLDVSVGPSEVFSYLPDWLVEAIADMVGATYDDSIYHYTIPCDAGENRAAKFVFELGGAGGPSLNVETADLVVPRSAPLQGISGFDTSGTSETNTCLFGLQTREDTSSVSDSYSQVYNIGSSLLRRTYLVFDVANSEIAVAPVAFPSGSDAPSPSIAAFESWGAHVPSATLFCPGARCPECLSSDCAGGSGRDDDDDDDDYDWRHRSNSIGSTEQHWLSVAIGIGVTFGFLLLVAMVSLYIIFARRRRAAGPGTTKEVASEEGGGPETQMAESAAAGNADGGTAVPPAGSLRVSQENQAAAVPTPAAQSPQPPAVAVVSPPSSPQPTASSNRNSMAVSAVSDDQQPTAPVSNPGEADPASPKGKAAEAASWRLG